MDAAIASNDWFEVGELLKQEIIEGKYTTDLLKLHRYIHYIDPEILALHYMCSELKDADRQKVGTALSKLVEVNSQAKDILAATNVYYTVIKGNEESEQQAQELIQTTTSNSARFICYLALIDVGLNRAAAQQVLNNLKSLLGVYRKNKMQWMDNLIEKYITPIFVLCLRLQYLDLSIFSDVTNFIHGDAGKLYAQLKDINQFNQAIQLTSKLQNGTEIVATSDMVAHHARVAKLQTHLLMLQQQQRINMPYADLMKIMQFTKEEDLEQIVIQLTLLGILDSQIDTIAKTITITHVKALAGSQEIKQILVQRLEEWICKVAACKELFASIVENEQDD